ncbi:RNA polymerase-associated protein RapA [Enhygromyxa salina]|uniref:RNA polymerase-associated protein RapA n=1 Tax=Enhygromyxa salina TaxID=215803 RepID=A0A2S9YWQ8_9BACT|nr:DISARM system SNF2-like helicase DrmD [Enhygromyxa salina]PRQ09545.1 RNA polymerase-associated protein RapA [Enhygromyxa salina]
MTPNKLSILEHLGRKRLLRLRDHFEIDLPPSAESSALIDALTSVESISLANIVGRLNSRELAKLCELHELPGAANKGQDAATLLDAHREHPTPTEQPVQPKAPAPTVARPVGHRWRDADPLEPGQIVRVRSRQYLVEDLTAPKQHGDATLVRLSCLEDDALGEPLEVLWECEIDARILGKSSWEAVAERGFDRPELFSAYLHTLRWNCVTSTDPKLFQAPYRAGIQVKDYQLEPLRKALLMPRVHLFVADDVGLGKTIEAGLILREMLMRQRVRRVIVACPPSVVQQWRDEMEQRFGLTFIIVDRAWFAEIRRERGWGANLWKTHSRFIISHALLRDATYAGPLRDHLGTFSPSSMLILDEAHNAAPASGARYAIDSNLTRTVRDLAPRFEHKLFLSATPHNGHSNSFAALLEILDPQRFCRGVPVHPDQLADVMVRRLKADVRELVPGEFAERIIEPIIIEGLPDDAPELELSRRLQRLRELRSERLANTNESRRSAAMLVLTSLQKRLLSSIEAFYRTLDVHRRAIERRAKKAAKTTKNSPPGDLSLLRDGVGSDDERAELSEDAVCVEEQAQLETASAHANPEGPSEDEGALLSGMLEIAAAHRYSPAPRFERLVAWIREHQCPEFGVAVHEGGAVVVVGLAGLLERLAGLPVFGERKRLEIIKLCELHAAMDHAVLEAYGWHDLAERATCEFQLEYEEDDEDDGGHKRKKKKPWRYKWPQEFHDEVLARLLELNQTYAEEERLAGEGPSSKKAKPKKKRDKKKPAKKKSSKKKASEPEQVRMTKHNSLRARL